jgi:hypothetical protein
MMLLFPSLKLFHLVRWEHSCSSTSLISKSSTAVFRSRLSTLQVTLGKHLQHLAKHRADANSGGLNPTGSSNGMCSSSTGQVYTRAGTYNGKFGIMYSWYMPKDSPSTGLGHRHDWENIVVWLSAQSTSATLTGVAISAHGDYQKNASPPLQGTSPKIGYISYFPVNHQLIATNDLGGQQPLIAWDSMTAAARTAIESTVSRGFLLSSLS